MKLVCFDLDGTLIESYMDDPEPNLAYLAEPEVLPGRIDRLQELEDRGHAIAIITNQGGVAKGHVTEGDFWARVTMAKRKLRVSPSVPVFVCFAHPGHAVPVPFVPAGAWDLARRKPSGAMIVEAMRVVGASWTDTLFVGDYLTDEQAAKDAGVGYSDASDFFA